MGRHKCIECSRPAKWVLELPTGEITYTCAQHLAEIRNQLETLIEGIDNPELAISNLLTRLHQKGINESEIP